MSLRSRLNQCEIRAFLKDQIHNHGMKKPTVLVSSMVSRGAAGRVGTAFDDAFRFGLSADNHIGNPWRSDCPQDLPPC